MLIQQNIKFQVLQKISDLTNKKLYPSLMGPHPIYTMEIGQENKLTFKSVQLKQKLKNWLKMYWEKKFSQIKCKKVPLLMIINNKQNEITEHEEKSKEFSEQKVTRKTGSKYKKYSIEMKKEIVNKIKQQISSIDIKVKPLRFYLYKQAKLLGIHHKNIIRWFEDENLEIKKSGRKAKFPKLQYHLAKFIKQNPDCKRKQVISEGKRILAQSGEEENFQFSKGWYTRFRVRLRKGNFFSSAKSTLKRQPQDLQKQIVQKKLENEIITPQAKIEECKNQSCKLQEFSMSQIKENYCDECKLQQISLTIQENLKSNDQSFEDSQKMKEFFEWRSNLNLQENQNQIFQMNEFD